MSYKLSADTTLQLGQVIYELAGSKVLPFVAQSKTEAQCWENRSNSALVSEFGQRLFFSDESAAFCFLYDVKRIQAKIAQQEADDIRDRIMQRHDTTVADSPPVELARPEFVGRAALLERAAARRRGGREPMWGFGRKTTGGAIAGGDKYLVDTTQDSRDPGSLRHALETASNGGREIFFLVNGNIELTEPLHIMTSNVSIHGPTSGSAGVRIVGFPVFAFGVDNIIIKNIGFRNGGGKNQPLKTADSFEASNCCNVFIDRCSFAWSVDECCSLTHCQDCTVQRSIIAYSLKHAGHPGGPDGNHAYGGIYSSKKGKTGHGISLIGNLYAHHTFRPNIIGEVQIVKCIFYNYDTSYPVNIHTSNDHPITRCDLQRCEFQAGPSTTDFRQVRIDWDDTGNKDDHGKKTDGRHNHLWQKDNFVNGTKVDNLIAGSNDRRKNVSHVKEDHANFHHVQLSDAEIDGIDPATDSGPLVGDALDNRVLQDYCNREGRDVLIDKPEDLFDRGADDL